mgnify:FL=1
MKGYRIARQLQGLINVEKKYSDVTSGASPILVNYSGAIVQLTNIAQGDAINQRGGNSILMKSLMVRGYVEHNTGIPHSIVRVMLVLDTMNTGTAPTVANILSSTGGVWAPSSLPNVTDKTRFKILSDKTFDLNNGANTIKSFKTYVKLNKHAKYTGSLGTDEFKNQLYMLYVSDVNASDPGIVYYARVGYYDN